MATDTVSRRGDPARGYSMTGSSVAHENDDAIDSRKTNGDVPVGYAGTIEGGQHVAIPLPPDGHSRLTLEDGTSILLPQEEDPFGLVVVNVGRFFKWCGGVLLDPGLFSTAFCESSITYINGDKGKLYYRGIPIQQIVAGGSDHLETTQLLLYGTLPLQADDDKFRRAIAQRMPVHPQIGRILNVYPIKEHPLMSVAGQVLKLATPELCELDPCNPDDAALHLIAKAPTLGAMAYRHRFGIGEYVAPDPKLGYAANLLNMCFKGTLIDGRPWRLAPAAAQAMELVLLLHADHEQNASTATVRLSGSTGNSPFASIVAGIMSLSGPAHGGANEAALKQLQQLLDNAKGDVDKAADEAVALARRPAADGGSRLMGFGHRVYKNRDPRAEALRGICDELFKELRIKDPLFELAQKLEKVALLDEYFLNKKLYPNVDFYSGIILKALGFPPEMYTVIFAIGRTAGWVAQYQEMLKQGPLLIGRPRQYFNLLFGEDCAQDDDGCP
ncbi:MAG: citrate/2-methylcitrate synthase, partial [Vulcanimicrobiaceae bacterium]